jgi:radical SAM superfamily enzyme YgiQ (UPF0313 family)
MKMKNLDVLIVDPPRSPSFFNYLQQEPLLLTSLLEKEGIISRIYYADYPPIGNLFTFLLGNLVGRKRNFQKELLFVIKKFSPKIVVFHSLTGDLLEIIKLSQAIKKEDEKIKVLIYGVLPYFFSDVLIKKGKADTLVKGFNEELISKIIFLLLKNKKVKKINTSLNQSFPHVLPNDELVLFKEKIPKIAFLSLRTSRGCNFRCSFCAVPYIYKRKFYTRDIKEVIKEIKEKIREYKLRTFFIEDESFTSSKKWSKDFCNEVKKYRIKFGCISRADLLTPSFLKELRSGGCYQLLCGIESGDQSLLDYLVKDLDLKMVKRNIREIKNLKIESVGFFLFTTPFENEERIFKTLSFIRKLQLDRIILYQLFILPHTSLYIDLQKKHILRKSRDNYPTLLNNENSNLINLLFLQRKVLEIKYFLRSFPTLLYLLLKGLK